MKMHISETTSIRHEISSCVEDDMLDHIVSKMKDAWWKSTLDGNGKIEIEWDSRSATVTAWDRGIVASRVHYSVVKDADDMENNPKNRRRPKRQ